MSESTPRKRRRVARYVSDVDRHLIAEGLPPSWEDRVRPEDTRPGSMADAPDRGDGANDARLLANVPPHAQARAARRCRSFSQGWGCTRIGYGDPDRLWRSG